MDRSKGGRGKGGKSHQPLVGSELIALGKGTRPGQGSSTTPTDPEGKKPGSGSKSSSSKLSSIGRVNWDSIIRNNLEEMLKSIVK